MQKKLLFYNVIYLSLMLLGAFVVTGCGMSQKYGVAKINSTPSGAEIFNLKDNTNLGITPAKVLFKGEADTSEFVTIQLRKLGYVDRITTFWINRRHSSIDQAERGAIDIHVELEKLK